MTAAYPDPQLSRDKAIGHTRSVLTEVFDERLAQVDTHNRSQNLDDAYIDGELAKAAGAYALNAAGQASGSLFWPWPWAQWKPKDARRDLIRSAALAVAEVERIDRAAALAGASS